MAIKAIIFDMGGVILRTEDPSSREALARRLGTTRRELEKKVFQSESSLESEVGKITDAEHWHIVLQHYGLEPESYPQVYKEFFAGDTMDEVIIEYIKQLKKDYKIGLLSNAWVNARENLSRLYDFQKYFDDLVFSAEVGMRKPDERIFRLVLERLEVEPQEAIFIDDFAINITGATEIGIHAVLYKDRDEAIGEVNQLLNRNNPD